MALSEIPLAPAPRTMTIGLGQTTYTLRFAYADAPEGGWFVDISDAAGQPLVCGVPLVTGADLLAQFRYLGFTGNLFVMSDAAGGTPTYDGLGLTSHLYYEDASSFGGYLAAYLDRFIVTPRPTSGAIGAMAIGVGEIGAWA